MSAWPMYGIVAEFDDPTVLVEAARAVKSRGYRRFEAYSPYPLEELNQIVPGIDPVPLLVLGGGFTGAIVAFGMQCYIAIVDYPINVGGRPLYSWPAFIPITFELTILFAACTAFLSVFWLAGLPLLHHPVFSLADFARTTQDRFFLCIESRDIKFSPEPTTEFLRSLNPLSVYEVNDE